jgi:hypothetical protein
MPRTPSSERERQLQAALRAALVRYAIDEIGSAFRPHRVTAAPFRGALLALTLPEFDRPFEDLDLLVAPEAFATAARALRQLGYRAGSRQDFATMFVHPERPLPVDLHRAPFPPRLFLLPAAAVLARARADARLPEGLRAPAPLDTYALLIGHFAKDRSDGRRPERLRELGHLSTHHALAPRQAAEHLASHGLGRAARYVLGLAARHLGDPFAAAVLRELPRDPISTLLTWAASSWIGQFPPGAPATAPAAHLLNTTLPRGMASLGTHLAEAVPRRLRAAHAQIHHTSAARRKSCQGYWGESARGREGAKPPNKNR